MITVFVLPMLLALQAPSYSNAGNDGTSLYQECLAYLRTSDNPDHASQTDISKGNRCFTYIQGFVDGSNIDGPKFCTPGGTMGTGIRVYVNYVQRDPTILDAYKAEGVFRAFREAYPCAAKTK